MNLCIFNNGASREEVNMGATALNMHSSWMESFYDYYIVASLSTIIQNCLATLLAYLAARGKFPSTSSNLLRF